MEHPINIVCVATTFSPSSFFLRINPVDYISPGFQTTQRQQVNSTFVSLFKFVFELTPIKLWSCNGLDFETTIH